MGLKKHILDALICLTLQEKVHQNFYLAVHAIAYLQSLSVIAQTSTTLHELTSWSDPSSYVSPETLLSLIGLYISSNTSILTTPLDRKIAVLNSALVLNIFRVIFTGTKAIGSAVHLISLALYVLCFGLVTARNPIISYRNNILY